MTVPTMSRFPRVLLSLALPLQLLFSLAAPAQDGGRARGIEVGFLAVAHLPDPGEVSISAAGVLVGESFELPLNNLSPNQMVPGRSFTLVATNAAAADGEPPAPLATIRLPEEGASFRILLVPMPEGVYRPLIVRGDDPSFRAGDVHLLNLSRTEVLGNLGSSALAIRPGEARNHTLVGDRDESYFEIRFATRNDGGLVPLTDTRWPLLRRSRVYVIFFNEPSGNVSYRAVDEYLPPPGGN